MSRGVSIPDASGPLPDAVLRYAERPDAVVDVFLPRAARRTPLVMFVHGGFWRAASTGPTCVRWPGRWRTTASW